jgi:hypothetical protein
MRTLAALAAAASALLAAPLSLAQEPAEASAASAAPATPQTAPAPASAPAAAPSTGITVTIPQCRLADHAGIDDADAWTAGQLVCAEISHAGPPEGARYRVSLGKLGSVIILSVAREGETLGSTADSRELRLQGIEEVSVAAPRIAESIVHGAPLRETERVDNLVGEETRVPKSKPGKAHFAVGLVGQLPPLDRGIAPAPGASLDLHYETSTFEVGGAMRFGGGSSSETAPSIGFFNLSLGGRLFTTKEDMSPYFGAGLSWGYLNLKVPETGFSGDNSGLGAFVDAGVEVMRTHHAHLSAGLRLDLPFYAVNNKGYDGPNYSPPYGGGSPGPVERQNSLYYAPLSLELRLTF